MFTSCNQLHPPVNDHIVELLLLLDARRRSRAARVTAVVPYFGARIDAPPPARRSALRLSLMRSPPRGRSTRRRRPHTPALEAQCHIPVEILTAVPALSAELALGLPEGAVVVAPDLGWPSGITTGATIEAAARLLRLRGAAPDIVVAATHGLWSTPP
jgi:ribose-phosphate pyrophosphokinase